MIETIAAIATPSGRGGVGVIRISGPLCQHIARSMLGVVPKPRLAHFSLFKDAQGNSLDQGISLYFPAPHSFTGEDVLELQGHGGPIVQNNLLASVLQLGARMARPGEFSERAFLNGKIDLTQAEAIADLIDSTSTQAAKAAMHSLQGAFSQAIFQLVEKLTNLRVLVEAAIDFSEEEIDFLNNHKIKSEITELIQQLETIFSTAEQGALLREGMTVVIAGRPNAGKSSLLNQLTAKNTAIVTDIPGTTRDTLREYIHIDGLPLHIIDTAGLHESSDVVEQEGIRRALKEIAAADQILWVVDDQEYSEQQLGRFWPEIAGVLPDAKKLTVLRNKVDLTNKAAEVTFKDNYHSIKLSAKTGDGIDLLKEHLKKTIGFHSSIEGKFIARQRHLDALKRAAQYLKDGLDQFNIHHAGELLAEDLRQAQQALGEITGKFTANDLLGKIFSSFCIGK